jgi:hypothetical protein
MRLIRKMLAVQRVKLGLSLFESSKRALSMVEWLKNNHLPPTARCKGGRGWYLMMTV